MISHADRDGLSISATIGSEDDSEPFQVQEFKVPETLHDFGFDGGATLEHVIVGAGYETLERAVAALTVFSAPAVVAETGNRNLFRMRRK